MPNTKATGVAYADPEFESISVTGNATVTGSLVVGGNTISATELGYLDGITPGTVAANKAIVPTTNNHIDTIVISDSGLKLGAGAGTAVTATAAEINTLAGVTAGTTTASKAVVLDAAEHLAWATTSSVTGSDVATLSVIDTRTGAGGVGWAAKFDLETNVALGAYINGLYGYLAFGASGRVTGLASGTVGEIVLSAGCTEGTYACFEAEMGCPTGAATGTDASFLHLSLYGAGAAVFDTNGLLFNLQGVTKAGGKLLQDTTTGSTARPVQALKVKTPDGIRYLPLYDTVAIAA